MKSDTKSMHTVFVITGIAGIIIGILIIFLGVMNYYAYNNFVSESASAGIIIGQGVISEHSAGYITIFVAGSIAIILSGLLLARMTKTFRGKRL